MMGKGGSSSNQWDLKLRGKFLVGLVVVASLVVAAESSLEQEGSGYNETQKIVDQSHSHSVYKHNWPKMTFGWRIVVGAIIGFLGAAFGSAGGVGGGGIFVPMLTLVIGFDAKSSIAISKCMITGAAASTVYYNLNERHPTLEMPVIDYDLALLFQPMLVLGVSIGVTLNVIFADWMITVLLIILFIFVVPSPPRGSLSNDAQTETNQAPKKEKVSVIKNVYWKALGFLFSVWLIILALQIAKNYVRTCSVPYWIFDFAQVPVAASVTIYQAVWLHKGKRRIASKGAAGTDLRVVKLVMYCFCGLLAGAVGGLLGLGGGYILGPLFLEMGIPPQVSSATSTFAMTFSASMSVIEYYLLKRFPVPYGGVGLADMIKKIQRKEYMGFDTICS
ncbi:hypothetical protein JCGZ_06293 [Jatropha curcas]|uniref:Sulfite exporter TauE/SafE family protein n=1 Tax=Jatropha curcas TaxID=180498 RepID=A0A067KMC5_JATCU|nr:hypothetical protein JCGZ_06293 [Jatropha curcas]